MQKQKVSIMQRKNISFYGGILFIFVFFSCIGIQYLTNLGHLQSINTNVLESQLFRSTPLSDDMIEFLQGKEVPGLYVGTYWIMTNFEQEPLHEKLSEELFQNKIEQYSFVDGWDSYIEICRSIWNDVKYFPIPKASNQTDASISYVNSWMYERNYGKKRGHEGTALMAEKQERGYYPIVSMTDGVVRHKGWLEQGGWRIGIAAPNGAYFYYAHLDSYANLEEGDIVKAGDLLGYMGDTGYSKIEGTTGNFPIHLHLGIYLNEGENEISINPYPILKAVEHSKIKCEYSQ